MVLLHALGARGAYWAPVTGRFAERFQVFAFDLREHGDSDWPGKYSFELMRDDLVAALDELGLARLTVVGHSMGGAVAYLVTMHWPDQVGRLIVEDASPPFPRDRAIRPRGAG
jgi:3-oxoadipate enol-lactonase